MPVDQPQPVRVICVPDAEHLPCPSFLRNQFDPLVVSIANNELDRVDMPFKQPPQRQAARTNRSQDLAEGKTQ
jgi:hypothetical protein